MFLNINHRYFELLFTFVCFYYFILIINPFPLLCMSNNFYYMLEIVNDRLQRLPVKINYCGSLWSCQNLGLSFVRGELFFSHLFLNFLIPISYSSITFFIPRHVFSGVLIPRLFTLVSPLCVSPNSSTVWPLKSLPSSQPLGSCFLLGLLELCLVCIQLKRLKSD